MLEPTALDALARAIIIRAYLDATNQSETDAMVRPTPGERQQARLWLRTTGLDWLEVFGMDPESAKAVRLFRG